MNTPPVNDPSVYIENLGCAKNQVDAEIMGARLEAAGWRWVSAPEQASLILVNTCGFIEPAQQESIDTALAVLAAHPDVPVALTGCLAQRFSGDLAEGMPELAGVFGNRRPERIVEFVERLLREERDPGSPLVWLPDGGPHLADPQRSRLLSHAGSVFLKVAEGCNHNCSFCAIPSIRGVQRTRESSSILEEFRVLRGRGLREFNLVAQDLAAWYDGQDGTGPGIMALLETLLAEPGDFWLRPLYLYPDTFPLQIVELSRRDPRLLPYFDLSFQHGSVDILRRMGRPGEASRYLDLISSIREINPDVALRSSFIVGFPGERENHFQQLLDFVQAAELEWVGVFEFSPQAGTPAGDRKGGSVPAAEKRRRRERLEALQQPITTRRLERFLGRTIPVLLEESIQGTDIALGRSRMQAPEVDGLVVVHGVRTDARAGDRTGAHLPAAAPPSAVRFVDARVTGVTGVDLQADYLGDRD